MTVEHASLHNHSHFSVLDGYATIPEYVERAKDLGLRGLGLTDHGTISGIYEFIQTANKYDITPIPGCEMYVAPINPEGAKVKHPVYYGRNGKKDASGNDVAGDGAYLHMTVLAVSTQGLYNLLKLSSLSYEPEHNYKKPRVDLEMLAQYSEGLVASTGCPSGEISTRFLLGQKREAYDYAGRLKDIFGEERLFVEIMDHDMSIDLERKLIPHQMKLAKDMGLKLLATNDSHYAFEKNVKRHEEMLCSQSGSVMREKPYEQGGSRFAFNGSQYFLKSGEEMLNLFPQETYPNAVSNSLLISEMAQGIKLGYNSHLRPNPVIPEGYTEISYFTKLIKDGYKQKYGNAPREIQLEAQSRINPEVEMFVSSNFVGYFLTVHEYINFAKKEWSTYDPDGNILAPSVGFGRGSVGGCICAYLLGISEIDPIRYGLLSERFMTPGRGETFRITYEDGTYEDVLASEARMIQKEEKTTKRYIHQLNAGDVVVTED